MTRGVAYSRRYAALSLVALGAAFAMAWLHHHVNGEKIEQRRGAAAFEADLGRRIAARSDCDDPSLRGLRARVGRFREELGPEDAWERLVVKFGRGWTAEAGSRDEKDGYTFQAGTLLLLSSAPSDWPAIVEAVGVAEQLPGVGFSGFEMKSSGDTEHRSLDLVKIVVAIHSRKGALNQ